MADEKERLLARKQEIEARLAAIENAERKQREQQEKRRAELAGQAVLKHARKDEAFARQLRTILDAEITGVRLRALFDLPANTEVASAPKAPREASG
ncbi:MAG TPA: hypothetical protein VMN03_01055 [Burkholderiales bacterium]|nr:hypothetical protein [Burkholderiales bacterium]